MASIVIIPILLVVIVGLSSYLLYRFVIYDMLSKRRISNTLKQHNIRKTPSQIIREYYALRDEPISISQIAALEKNYRQNEPDQFLAMYDAIREKSRERSRGSE